jgi:D-alanyl-D-alanine-carboxypeptidase/D-alanyl-D-alanine-endopeptidase
VWHNGQTAGYASFVGFSPARGVGVVVLSNTAHTVDDLALALLTGAPLAGARPARTARTVLALPVAALERFVGEYPFAPTFVLTIRRDGDHLVAQATGQPALELFAESPTTFFFRAVDAQLEFATDAAGAVTGLVLVQNGIRQPAPKRTSASMSRPAAGVP